MPDPPILDPQQIEREQAETSALTAIAQAGTAAAQLIAAGGEIAERVLQGLQAGVNIFGEVQPVASTMISGAGYEATTGELIIEYVKGPVYRYQDVPVSVFIGLLQAPSKGEFMHAEVLGQYAY